MQRSAALPTPQRITRPATLATVFFAGALGWVAYRLATGTAGNVVATALTGVTILLYGVLAVLVLRQRGADPRARLFALTGAAVAMSLLLVPVPAGTPPSPWLVAYLFVHASVYGMIPAIVVNMTAAIAGPPPFVQRRPWLLPGVYLVMAALTLAVFAAFANALYPFLPWRTSLQQAGDAEAILTTAGYLAAAVLGLAMLGHAARRAPTVEARRQALVVLAGFFPWSLNTLSWVLAPSTHEFAAVMVAEAATILLVPVALAVSIVRYHLFQATVVIRRGVVYGLTAGLLAALVYLAVEALAHLARPAVGEAFARGALAVLLIVAGAFFRPTTRRVGAAVDRRIFPEKVELRRLERGIIAEMVGFTTLAEAGAHLVGRVRDALQLSSASLLISDPERETLRLLALAGEPAAGTRDGSSLVLPLDALAPWRERLERGEPFPRAGRDAEGPELRAALDALGTEIVVPVILRERLIGLLLLGPHPTGHELEGDDFERLGSIARQVSAMLENVRLFDLATRDPLTSLPRRHVAAERLAHEVERSRRAFRPLAVLFADVDHFKRVNDTHGHAAGDAVLREVAATLAAVTRRTDLLARFGGEEFLAILTDTGVEGARTHAEALRRRVAETPAGGGIRVTLSIGVCAVDAPAGLADADELIRRADEALYRAKQLGRDRVEVYIPAESPHETPP